MLSTQPDPLSPPGYTLYKHIDLYLFTRGGQNEDCQPSTSIFILNTTCLRHRLPKKKGRIVQFLITILDLWKSRGIGRNVFLH